MEDALPTGQKKIPVKTGIVVTLSLLSVESVRVWF